MSLKIELTSEVFWETAHLGNSNAIRERMKTPEAIRDEGWSVANIWKTLTVHLISLITWCSFSLLLMPSDRDMLPWPWMHAGHSVLSWTWITSRSFHQSHTFWNRASVMCIKCMSVRKRYILKHSSFWLGAFS